MDKQEFQIQRLKIILGIIFGSGIIGLLLAIYLKL